MYRVDGRWEMYDREGKRESMYIRGLSKSCEEKLHIVRMHDDGYSSSAGRLKAEHVSVGVVAGNVTVCCSLSFFCPLLVLCTESSFLIPRPRIPVIK